MKKPLLMLALPILMLTACNDSSGKKQVVSYKEFQKMTERSITEGLLVNATFTVTFNFYNVNPETGEKTLNEGNSESIDFIADHARYYIKQTKYNSEFILENDNVYKKNNEGTYESMGMSYNNLDAYNKYGSAVRRMQYDIMGQKKNGKYSSTEGSIYYKMNDEDQTIYSVMYGKGNDGLDYFKNYVREYFYSPTIYHYFYVGIQSYSGTVPSLSWLINNTSENRWCFLR